MKVGWVIELETVEFVSWVDDRLFLRVRRDAFLEVEEEWLERRARGRE